jgi:hypothetical protein
VPVPEQGRVEQLVAALVVEQPGVDQPRRDERELLARRVRQDDRALAAVLRRAERAVAVFLLANVDLSGLEVDVERALDAEPSAGRQPTYAWKCSQPRIGLA